MLPDNEITQQYYAEREQDRNLLMYGCPQEWIDELIEDWSQPLMGGLQMLAMSMLSDAQECIAVGRHETARQYINRAKYVIKQNEVTNV